MGRPQQLVEGGEGLLDLGLHADAAQQVEVAGVLEQSVLAHAGLAADDQRPAASPACVGKERGDAARSSLRPYSFRSVRFRGHQEPGRRQGQGLGPVRFRRADQA